MEKTNSGFEGFIHHLNEEEASNPKLVIDEFFRFSTLPESITLLWDWLRIMRGEDFDQMKETDQDKMLRFYVNLEKLIEAAYLIKMKTTSG
jgi:hypothetical protein